MRLAAGAALLLCAASARADYQVRWDASSAAENEEAVRRSRAAAAANPSDEEAYFNWAFALAALGRREEAVEKYRKVVEINPRNAQAYSNWGAELNVLNRQDEAVEKFRRAIELNPGDDVAYGGWARCLSMLGKPAEALEKADKAAGLNPNNIDALLQGGFAAWKLGRHAQSMERLEKAAELEPRLFDMAGFGWGDPLAALLLRDGAAAFSRCEAASARRPDLRPRYFAEARKRGEAAAGKHPANPEPRFFLGAVYEKGGEEDLPKALESFRAYLKMKPQAADAADVRGRIDALESKVGLIEYLR